MSKKILPLILTTGFALLFNACGSDGNSVSGIDCDEGDCFEESSSSVSKEDNSSSSIKKESSSSAKDEKSSSSLASSSSSAKEESSSSEKAESSSSEVPESSSSVKITYLNTTPNLADLEVSGDTLFAIFQRQSADYTIPEVGLLALYDAESGDLLDTIRLATKNPSAVKVSGGTVYVATAGEYDATWSLPADENRGIEKIDLQKKTSTLFVSGKSLGGGVSSTGDFVINANGTKGYAAVYQSYGSTPVVEIDLATGSVKTIEGIKNASGSLEYDDANGLLYIGEYFMEFEEPYEMNIGVFAYNGKTVATLTNENDMRPPYSIKLLDNSLYVFVSDYSSGKLYMDYQNFSDGISYYQDSKLAVAGNSLYLMERSTAPSISKIDLATGKPSSSWQVSLDAASNPYDIVLASDGNLWVALYGTAELRKVSVEDGSTLKSVKTDTFCAHE